MKTFLSCIMLIVLMSVIVPPTVTAFAAIKSDSSSITIDDLAWLSGRWIGEGFGGVCEEVWNQPLGNSMTGSFKLATKDGIGFYEIMTFSITDGKPILRLKHFDTDLTGWEEKNEVISFEFKSLSKNYLQFEGISYQLTQPDSLTITVGNHNSEGESHLTILNCHRE